LLSRFTFPLAIVLALALWSVSAQPVTASLALIFVPSEAKPGATVEAHTGGEGAITAVRGGSELPVFLAPADVAGQISSRSDGRLTRLGDLSVDSHANGHMAFVVPDIPYGDYLSFIYCEPCATHSAGRSLLPAGPFRVGSAVVGAPNQPAVSNSTGGFRFLIAAAIGSVAVILVGALWLRRSNRRPSSSNASG